MSDIKDGGLAFPCNIPTGYATGMTMRDWFAGQALAGMLAQYADNVATATIAGYAYEMADAMLKAREASND